MSGRLLRLAKAVTMIDVGKPDDGAMRGFARGEGPGLFRDKEPQDKDLDLKAKDLAARLEEAVLAINDCVAILEELGMGEEQAGERILSIVRDEGRGPEAIPGGLAAGRPDSDFDSEQLEKGIAVELEHTGDKEKAKEIAQDHLSENSRYYTYLEEMEEKAKRESREGDKDRDEPGE